MSNSDDEIDEQLYNELFNNNFSDFTEYLGKEDISEVPSEKLISISGIGKLNSIIINEEDQILYKIINDPYCADIKQFLREIEITYRSFHPCSSELLGFELFKNPDELRPYIATRYYSKGSLKNLLSPIEKATTFYDNEYVKIGNVEIKDDTYEVEDGTIYTLILYGIARAMRNIHNLQIDHRDIKTDNIFLDDDNHPHFGDYGLSKQDEDKEDSNMSKNSLYGDPYRRHNSEKKKSDASKSENENPKKYQQASDIYSLSFIFYELYEFHLYPYSFAKIPIYLSPNLEKNLQKINTSDYSRKKLKYKFTPEPAQDLINQMREKENSMRPNINEICLKLEKKDFWFKNTDPVIFYKYKQKIDQFESINYPKFRGIKYLYYDDFHDIYNFMNNQDKTKDEKWQQIDLHNQLILKYRSLNFNAGVCLAIMHLTGFYGFPKDVALSYKFLNNLLRLNDLNAYAIHKTVINEVIKYEKQFKNNQVKKDKEGIEEKVKEEEGEVEEEEGGGEEEEEGEVEEEEEEGEVEEEEEEEEEYEEKDTNENKDNKNTNENKDNKNTNENKDNKNTNENKDNKNTDENKDNKNTDENKDNKNTDENKEEKNSKDEKLKNYCKIDPDKLLTPKGQLLMGMVSESLGFIADAINLYTESAMQGLREAKGRLGALLFKLGGDYETAEQLLIGASGWDNKSKTCILSPQDARKLFNDTLINSNDERNISLFHLGLMYLYPNVDEKSKKDESIIKEKRENARNIFFYLNNSKYPDASYALALSYHMDNNLEEAAKWYKLSYDEFANYEAKEIYDQIMKSQTNDNNNNNNNI